MSFVLKMLHLKTPFCFLTILLEADEEELRKKKHKEIYGDPDDEDEVCAILDDPRAVSTNKAGCEGGGAWDAPFRQEHEEAGTRNACPNHPLPLIRSHEKLQNDIRNISEAFSDTLLGCIGREEGGIHRRGRRAVPVWCI